MSNRQNNKNRNPPEPEIFGHHALFSLIPNQLPLRTVGRATFPFSRNFLRIKYPAPAGRQPFFPSPVKPESDGDGLATDGFGNHPSSLTLSRSPDISKPGIKS